MTVTATAAHPPMPDHLLQIREEVILELTDPEYYGRTHGANLYRVGCRGPICTKFLREEDRKSKGTTPRASTQVIDAFIDFYAARAVEVREELTNEFIKSLQEKVRAAIEQL